MIWHLTIWSFITFVQHFVRIVFFCRHGALNLKFGDSGTLAIYLHCLFPKPPLHKTQTLHQWFSAMCLWDPRVAGFHYKEPLQWTFHWLVSTLWLNMCKPVKSADGETGWIKKTLTSALLGPFSMWLKSTALQEAGVTDLKKKDVIVMRNISCRCMLQINHSDIILLLKCLPMLFLSDALMLSTLPH